MQHFGAPGEAPDAAGRWAIFRHDTVVLSGEKWALIGTASLPDTW